ncbi:MAG: glycosyltransferase WbuB [Acidobacteria bacterium]|nr:MAG: glycosyltransferase WbuB [Acidobacteriota bacterium]
MCRSDRARGEGLRIYLVDPHDTLPGELWGNSRAVLLAEYLSRAGHTVVWWASAFSHNSKTFRATDWEDRRVSAGLTVRIVPVPGYSRHVSLARLWSLWLFGWRTYRRAIRDSIRPDCIVLTLPAPGSDLLISGLARRLGIPLVTDLRDLWPELFVAVLPTLLRPAAGILAAPILWCRRVAMRRADGLVAVSQTYLQVARTEAQRPSNDVMVKCIPWGPTFSSGSCDGRAAEFSRMDSGGVVKEPGEIWAIYAGTLGEQYDIPTLLEAARILARTGNEAGIRIVVAGDGPMRQLVEEFTGCDGYEVLRYVGRVDPKCLAGYYGLADIGICPYSADSTVSLPIKAFDCFAAGIPVVSSLRGELERLLREERAGLQYEAGNPKSLAAAIRVLAGDKAKREEAGRNSLKVGERFRSDALYSTFVELIEAVACTRPNSRG